MLQIYIKVTTYATSGYLVFQLNLKPQITVWDNTPYEILVILTFLYSNHWGMNNIPDIVKHRLKGEGHAGPATAPCGISIPSPSLLHAITVTVFGIRAILRRHETDPR